MNSENDRRALWAYYCVTDPRAADRLILDAAGLLGLNERRLINMGFDVGIRLDLQAAERKVKALEAEVGRLRELLKLALCLLPRETPVPAELLPNEPLPTHWDWREIVAKIETRLLSEKSETHQTGV